MAVKADAAGTIAVGDLIVNRLGYGAMRLPGKGIWGDPPDPEAARAVLRRVVELGINFIDTAWSYGPGTSERLIGETLDVSQDWLGVATKTGLQRPGPDSWEPDGRPEQLRRDVEESLQYSLGDRRSEPVLEYCEAEGTPFMPRYPLDAGALARPGGPLDEVAAKHRATPGQVALAWLLHRSPVMLSIPGTSSIAHLEENVAAAALELDDDDLASLSD